MVDFSEFDFGANTLFAFFPSTIYAAVERQIGRLCYSVSLRFFLHLPVPQRECSQWYFVR